MKKIFFAIALMAALNIPILAQADLTVSEYVGIVTASIPGSELPAVITNGVNTRFDKDNPLTWTKFPHKMKEFGWVYEIGESEKVPAKFEVNMKITSGGYLTGVYDEKGDLVETREKSRNIPVPNYIMKAFIEGPYKDWKIVGNKEVINYFQTRERPGAEQHFKLNIEKNNERKKLAYDYSVSTGKLEARLIR
jgi:hypothetical protein